MTHTVAALFGAMIALLVYTRLGGMATVLVAGAVLVLYICAELYIELRQRRAEWDHWRIASRRLRALERWDHR